MKSIWSWIKKAWEYRQGQSQGIERHDGADCYGNVTSRNCGKWLL